MHTPSRLRVSILSLCAVLLPAGAAFSQQSPVEYSKTQLEADQRVMRANISDANYHIDRGIKAAGAGLPDSAKVSLLRATGRIAQVDETMKSHPERIERLAWSLLYTRETVRKQLRAGFDKLRDDFGAVEDSMYALRRDMLRKGMFGEELQQQVAVLDAAKKLLPELEKKNPALAAKVRNLIEQINQALAAGDMAKAGELLKQLTATLVEGGHGQDIKDASDKINEGRPQAPDPKLQEARALAGRLAQTDPAAARSIEDLVSQIEDARRRGDTATADRLMAQLNELIRQKSGQDSQKQWKPGEKVYDENGNEVTDEYVWGPDGEGRGVDKVYVGDKGGRLVRETKVNVRATPSTSKPNTFEVTKSPGASRTWALVVAPVPGSEKKATGSYTVSFALTDRAGASGFTVTKWDITSPSGSPTLDSTTGSQVTATFSKSATYTVQVSGTTDWGSAFTIKTNLTVGVD